MRIRIQEILVKIEELIINKPDEITAKGNALKKALYSEFKHFNNKSSEIELIDYDNECIIKFNSNMNTIKDIKFGKSMSFEDVTYIESPFILQFRRMFQNAMTLLDDNSSSRAWAREKVSLHIKDLARKLSVLDPQTIQFVSNPLQNISSNINNLIEGDFYYDENQDDFILNRSGRLFSSINIASGIKSLGLFNTLLKGGVISKNSLLILDEPETNLHPKWQNKYAEILCDLVKENVKVIAVTHSPYMVSALDFYARNRNIENKRFYWANKVDDNSVLFEDKTSTVMEDIVQRFANVFNEIE